MIRVTLGLVVSVLACIAAARGQAPGVSHYQSLNCPTARRGSTWAVLDRDGANRAVAPYLSSLGHGESGTGTVTSPSFVIASDEIVFTICGHDGQGGGHGKNFIALVDVRKGKTLLQTPAPGNDALQTRSWDVSRFRGMEVRIEVHDGDAGTAFAWLGIGQIDASAAMKVDFRRGIPESWVRQDGHEEPRYELLPGSVPFRRDQRTYSIMRKRGAVEIPCGFTAQRLFLLGCTVAGGQPPLTYGAVEVHYRDGTWDTIPLICGVTLDGQYKCLSPAKTLQLHPSSDPYQPYLAVLPKHQVIAKLRLVTDEVRGAVPRITAITCETTDSSTRLAPLMSRPMSAEESAWIQAHSVTPESLREPIRQMLLDAQRRGIQGANNVRF